METENKKLPFSDMFEMPSDIFYSHDIRIRKMCIWAKVEMVSCEIEWQQRGNVLSLRLKEARTLATLA